MNENLSVIIMAAGEGTRLRPYSKKIPKVLAKIGNKTLLERNIEIVKNKLKQREVHIVLGHNADAIKKYLEEKDNIGIRIDYHQIPQKDIAKGLLFAMRQLQPVIKDHFMILLGDEVYFSSDHDKMLDAMKKIKDFDIYIMIKDAGSPLEILKNYSVEIDGNKISALKEKPKKMINNYAGLGTIAFSIKIFKKLEVYTKSNQRHFIDILDQGIKNGLKAYFFISQCEYYNVNNRDDLLQSRYHHRSKNINKYKKSLIIPAYNEAETIAYVVKDFKKYIDDILVMDNLSMDGTADIAQKAGARVISRKFKGYGDAIRQGLNEADGDILIITEADLTFNAEDLPKIIEYLKDADAVIGTRTNRSFIHAAANMGSILRIGNILIGKLISALWWNRKCRLSDVGCTYRALWKSSYDEIKDSLISNGPEFSAEMMVELLNSFLRLVEIPISYQTRVIGKSKISISIFHSIIVGTRMLCWIIFKRFKGWGINVSNIAKNILTRQSR